MQNTVVGERVEGECSKSSTADAECEVDESGEEVCSTPLASFAGSSDSVRVRNPHPRLGARHEMGSHTA